LTELDRGHAQLLRDRETLATVREAVGHLTGGTRPTGGTTAGTGLPPLPGPRSVGEVAHRLGVTPPTPPARHAPGLPPPPPAPPPPRPPPPPPRAAPNPPTRPAGAATCWAPPPPGRHQPPRGGAPAGRAPPLDSWQQPPPPRGRAMPPASARLDDYLRLRPET